MRHPSCLAVEAHSAIAIENPTSDDPQIHRAHPALQRELHRRSHSRRRAQRRRQIVAASQGYQPQRAVAADQALGYMVERAVAAGDDQALHTVDHGLPGDRRQIG